MNLHLEEISIAAAPGAHAVLVLDQAGWHLTPKLSVPENIAIMALPSRAADLGIVKPRVHVDKADGGDLLVAGEPAGG